MDVAIEQVNRSATVRLGGRFDYKSNLTFRNNTRPLLSEPDVDTIVIDFSDVPFVDSAALGLLLLLRAQAEDARKQVVLRACGPELQRILNVARFHLIFHIEQ